MDENYINNQFLGMFYQKQTFSLIETITKMVPDNLKTFTKMIDGFFTTAVFSHLFPDILKDYPVMRRMDFRCSFNK